MEINFDGLVGPTHNYAGLSFGNVASANNAKRVASPREAALQGLQKMWHLHRLGVPQAVLPPHERPDISLLKRLGFDGDDAAILSAVAKTNPVLLASACSASAMWTANAATVAPSADTSDKRVHFTPANLSNKLHRSIEPATTGRVLKAIFADEKRFAHHEWLPGTDALGDEGAANHTRFCGDFTGPGIQLFVYGRSAFDTSQPKPLRFPARHTLEASEAIARLHRLDPARVVLAQQNPEAIDAGVFHNDVISVGHQGVFLHHRFAFTDTPAVIRKLREASENLFELIAVEARAEEVPLADAVASYLFNSQIVTLPDESLAVIAPKEVEENTPARRFVERVIAEDNPIKAVHYLDLRQSMQNGGGPACLRLRVVLSAEERRAANQNVFMSDALYQRLEQWIVKNYREKMAPEDLADPLLIDESRRALDELTQILALGSIYPFQHV